MKNLTVLELSKLYGINRQTIYNHVNKGVLSKNSDNKIDLAEAIRVFGESKKKQDVKKSVKIDSQESVDFLLLRQQVDILKNQLADAKERESFYQEQIEVMQRLLVAPNKPNMTTFTDQDRVPTSAVEADSASVKTSTEDRATTAPDIQPAISQPIKPKQIPIKKRGLFGRVLNAVFSED